MVLDGWMHAYRDGVSLPGSPRPLRPLSWALALPAGGTAWGPPSSVLRLPCHTLSSATGWPVPTPFPNTPSGVSPQAFFPARPSAWAPPLPARAPCPGWRLLRPPLLALAVLPTGGPPSRSFGTADSSLPDVLVRGPSPPSERERPEGGGRGGLVSCCAVPQPRCPAGTFVGRVDGDGVPVRRRAAESGTESPGRVTGRAGTPGPSSGAHCRAAVFNSNLVSGSFC